MLAHQHMGVIRPSREKSMLVTDGEYSETSPGFLGDDGGQRRGGGRVEHRGHLVANQVTRPLDESARKAGALELPVGYLVGTTVKEIVGQPDSLRGGVDGVGATAAGAEGFGDDPAEGPPCGDGSAR